MEFTGAWQREVGRLSEFSPMVLDKMCQHSNRHLLFRWTFGKRAVYVWLHREKGENMG